MNTAPTVVHKYYEKSKGQRSGIGLKIAIMAILAVAVIIFLMLLTKIYLLVFLLPILISVLAPFIDTPALKKKGKLTYYSPLFLGEQEKNDTIVVHGGTLFDYTYVIDRKLSGRQRTRLILLCYIQGLIKLIDSHTPSSNPNLSIKGTTYIIGVRTAQRIGLTPVRTDFAQTFILIFNYVNLTISYSYAKGKLSFPKLSRIRTFKGKLSDIAERRQFLLEWEQRLLAYYSGKR